MLGILHRSGLHIQTECDGGVSHLTAIFDGDDRSIKRGILPPR